VVSEGGCDGVMLSFLSRLVKSDDEDKAVTYAAIESKLPYLHRYLRVFIVVV